MSLYDVYLGQQRQPRVAETADAHRVLAYLEREHNGTADTTRPFAERITRILQQYGPRAAAAFNDVPLLVWTVMQNASLASLFRPNIQFQSPFDAPRRARELQMWLSTAAQTDAVTTVRFLLPLCPNPLPTVLHGVYRRIEAGTRVQQLVEQQFGGAHADWSNVDIRHEYTALMYASDYAWWHRHGLQFTPAFYERALCFPDSARALVRLGVPFPLQRLELGEPVLHVMIQHTPLLYLLPAVTTLLAIPGVRAAFHGYNSHVCLFAPLLERLLTGASDGDEALRLRIWMRVIEHVRVHDETQRALAALMGGGDAGTSTPPEYDVMDPHQPSGYDIDAQAFETLRRTLTPAARRLLHRMAESVARQ